MAIADAPRPGSRRLQGAALAGLIMATVASVAPVLTQPNEGYSGRAYLDPAGYLTQCYGERQVDPGLIYSKDQCAAKLRLRMARDYAPAIIRCVPDFADPAHRLAFGAAIDASYNAGPRGFCASPMARAFNAGRWAQGCAAFIGWRVTAGGRWWAGLDRRRREETTYCLTGRRA